MQSCILTCFLQAFLHFGNVPKRVRSSPHLSSLDGKLHLVSYIYIYILVFLCVSDSNSPKYVRCPKMSDESKPIPKAVIPPKRGETVDTGTKPKTRPSKKTEGPETRQDTGLTLPTGHKGYFDVSNPPDQRQRSSSRRPSTSTVPKTPTLTLPRSGSIGERTFLNAVLSASKRTKRTKRTGPDMAKTEDKTTNPTGTGNGTGQDDKPQAWYERPGREADLMRRFRSFDEMRAYFANEQDQVIQDLQERLRQAPEAEAQNVPDPG